MICYSYTVKKTFKRWENAPFSMKAPAFSHQISCKLNGKYGQDTDTVKNKKKELQSSVEPVETWFIRQGRLLLLLHGPGSDAYVQGTGQHGQELGQVCGYAASYTATFSVPQ